MLRDGGIDVEADDKVLETQHWLELIDGCVPFIDDVLWRRTEKYLLLESIGMVPIVELADIFHFDFTSRRLMPHNSQSKLTAFVHLRLNEWLAVVP